MSKEILYYETIQQLQDAIYKDALPLEGPIITPYTSMAKFLHETPRHPVRAMRKVEDNLFNPWFTPSVKMKQLLSIYHSIHRITSTMLLTTSEQKLLSRKADELLRSCRELLMIGINPNSIDTSTRELLIFREIYKAFYKCRANEQETILDRLARSWRMLANGTQLRNHLVEIFGKSFMSVTTVYFQGFCYITPTQKWVIDALEHAGFKICFLNNSTQNLDDKYYEIWQKNPEFKSIENVSFLENSITAGHKKTVIKLEEYDDVFSFVDDLKKKDPYTILFNPISSKSKNMANTFFAETPLKDKLLSYPLGQYIYSLYSIAKDQKHILQKDMKKCLGSGWVGRDRLIRLWGYDQLFVFFDKCQSRDDWEKMMCFMEAAPENFLDPDIDYYEYPVETSPEFFNKYLYYFSNQKAAKALFNDIRHIFHDVDTLVNGNNINISGLYGLIKEKESYPELTEKEQSIFETLKERTSHIPEDIAELNIEEAVKYIQYILGGKDTTYNDEEDIDAFRMESKENKISLFTLDEVEIAGLLPQNYNYVMGFCNAMYIPGSVEKYPWPLNIDILQNICNKAKQKWVQTLIQYYIFTKDGIIMANRYRFRIASQNSNMKFTWFNTDGDKYLSPSPYITLLQQEGVPTEKEGDCAQANISNFYVDYDYEAFRPDITLWDIMNGNVLKIEKDICGYRHRYEENGWVPTYSENNFLFSHYMSQLLNACMIGIASSGEDVLSVSQVKDCVRRDIQGFIPGLNNTELNSCIMYASNPEEQPNWTEEKPYYEFLLDNLHFEDSGISCKYCPYKKYCPKYYNKFWKGETT